MNTTTCGPSAWQRCAVCGRVGPDVALRPVVKAQAGAGTVLTLQCEDVTACWQERDKQEAKKEVTA